MNSKILILGASSDIGVELIKILLKDQIEIFAHCNKHSKKIKNLSKEKNIKIIKKNFYNISEKKFNIFLKNNLNFTFSKVVNLIGYIDRKNYNNTNLNSLSESIKINAIFPMFTIRHAVKKMLKKGYGRIVNCSSIGIKYGGGINSFNYSYSKHASEFIPQIYKNWAKKNVLINNLRIGLCNTKINNFRTPKEMEKRIGLIPVKRISTPKEIANYIYFFLSDKNSFITNENISISGGE